MKSDINIIKSRRHKIISSILKDSQNQLFYKKMDTLLVKKYFDNAFELTQTENILRVETSDLSQKDVFEILDNFFASVNNKTILKTRHLYEIVKLSNISEKKLKRFLPQDKLERLFTYLEFVSHETYMISHDFLILRIYQNFAAKNLFNDIKCDSMQKSLLNKMCYFPYQREIRDNENTFLCWIDIVLYSLLNKKITAEDLVLLIKKILNLTQHTVYLYWKILNSVSYLLLQQEHSAHPVLRKYKTEIEKTIQNKYLYVHITPEELRNLLFSTLTRQNAFKEDFYYLFDLIAIMGQTTNENRLFCLKICDYLLFNNRKRALFNHRFIRKYFIDILCSLLNKFDNDEVCTAELRLLIKILHTDSFFCFDRARILNLIIMVLNGIYLSERPLSYYNFYKYCDIVDFVMEENPDILLSDVEKRICGENNISDKVRKRFILCQQMGKI